MDRWESLSLLVTLLKEIHADQNADGTFITTILLFLIFLFK